MKTLNQVLKTFKDVAENNYFVNSVFIGDEPNFQSQENIYPSMIVMTQPSNIQSGRILYNFKIFFVDLINKDNSNINEIYSDMIQVITDFVAELKDNENEYGFTIQEENVIIKPIEYEMDDIIAGLELYITAEVVFYGDCDATLFKDKTYFITYEPPDSILLNYALRIPITSRFLGTIYGVYDNIYTNAAMIEVKCLNNTTVNNSLTYSKQLPSYIDYLEVFGNWASGTKLTFQIITKTNTDKNDEGGVIVNKTTFTVTKETTILSFKTFTEDYGELNFITNKNTNSFTLPFAVNNTDPLQSHVYITLFYGDSKDYFIEQTDTGITFNFYENFDGGMKGYELGITYPRYYLYGTIQYLDLPDLYIELYYNFIDYLGRKIIYYNNLIQNNILSIGINETMNIIPQMNCSMDIIFDPYLGVNNIYNKLFNTEISTNTNKQILTINMASATAYELPFYIVVRSGSLTYTSGYYYAKNNNY